MDMTISQGLRRIAKLKGQIKDKLERAASSITYESTKEPAFKFQTVMEEVTAISEELIKLEAALRLTNSTVRADFKGVKITLTEATVRLQEYKGQIAWFKGLPVRP